MTHTNRSGIGRHPFIAVICLLTTLRVWAADTPAAPPATQPALTELEQQFAARMTNAVMAGQYTLGEKGAPKADRYTIVSVRKLKDDNWLFNARVQFGDKDVTIPMIIPVKWAGDTPVISVTNLGFPGLGFYTARVVIYGDQYAGTWASAGANPHGGHLWGKIEKAPTTQPGATTRPAK
jgi:hypothetical protein